MYVSSKGDEGVMVNTKKYIGLVYCLFCLFMVGYSYLLLLLPPIAAAAVYTLMVALVYRACYKIFTYENFLSSDSKVFAFSLGCAALWPLYFLFGFFFFLINIKKRY